ncbi:MAG: hypothetical protein FWE09_02300 [Treponema sp.]|nr:hypothetical protein [Treponema sp.]
MTRKRWIYGIAAAVFALTLAGCGDGANSGVNPGPTPGPRTLSVTGVSAAQYAEGSLRAIYAVTTADTTLEQITAAMAAYVLLNTTPPAFVVAGFDLDDLPTDAAASISDAAPYTLTLPLYTPASGFKTRWNGTGNHIVWAFLAESISDYTVYRSNGSVNFAGDVVSLNAQTGMIKEDPSTNPGPGPGQDPNTLVITGVTPAQLIAGGDGSLYFVTPPNTTMEQVTQGILSWMSTGQTPAFVIAGFDTDYLETDTDASITPDPAVNATGPYTLTLPLYTRSSGFDVRWNGTGEYVVWAALSDGETGTLYRSKSNVTFSGGDVTRNAQSDFAEVYSGPLTPAPPDPGSGLNTLVLTGVTPAQLIEGGDGSLYFVTDTDTTVEQAISGILSWVLYGSVPPFVVAGFDTWYLDDDPDASITPNQMQSSGPFTLTLPLYTRSSDFNVRWNGTGEYIVWAALSDGVTGTLYRSKSNVTFSGGTITLNAQTDFDKVGTAP